MSNTVHWLALFGMVLGYGRFLMAALWVYFASKNPFTYIKNIYEYSNFISISWVELMPWWWLVGGIALTIVFFGG